MLAPLPTLFGSGSLPVNEDIFRGKVIATDPDGIDDLIGGVIEDEYGHTYATLVAPDQEGAYQAVFTWDYINSIRSFSADPYEQVDWIQYTSYPPGFFPYASVNRILNVVLFDAEGNSSTESIEIEFRCVLPVWDDFNSGLRVSFLDDGTCGVVEI